MAAKRCSRNREPSNTSFPSRFHRVQFPSSSAGGCSDNEQPEDGANDDDDPDGANGPAMLGEGGDGGRAAAAMVKCEHCGRPFKKERVAKHESACRKHNKAIGGLGQNFTTGALFAASSRVLFTEHSSVRMCFGVILYSMQNVGHPRHELFGEGRSVVGM